MTVIFQHFSALVPCLLHDAATTADEAGNAWWTEYTTAKPMLAKYGSEECEVKLTLFLYTKCGCFS